MILTFISYLTTFQAYACYIQDEEQRITVHCGTIFVMSAVTYNHIKSYITLVKGALSAASDDIHVQRKGLYQMNLGLGRLLVGLGAGTLALNTINPSLSPGLDLDTGSNTEAAVKCVAGASLIAIGELLHNRFNL